MSEKQSASSPMSNIWSSVTRRAALFAILLAFAPVKSLAMSCRDIFNPKQPKTSMRLREYVEIQTKNPRINYLIGSKFIEKAASRKDERGEFWTFMVYKHGKPQQRGASLSQAQLKPLLERYVRDNEWPRDLDPDQAAIDSIVQSMLTSPEYIDRAIRYADKIDLEGDNAAKGDRLKISNFGLNRFVRFKSEKFGVEVVGRILDLHYSHQPEGFYALIESIVPGRDKRRRHVGLITEAELASMQELSDPQKADIEQAFNEALSPNEAATRQLAEILKMQTFGYANAERGLGQDRSNGMDAMTRMSLTHYRAIGEAIVAKFGSIADMMTKDEAAREHVNVYDVMARYKPRYILERFEDKGSGYQYAFVITEDGQLKVSPHGASGMKPPSLRLAAGRRIFAAGTFVMNPSGEIEIMLDANEYQSHDITWGRARAFHTEYNGDLHKFISTAFHMQTGRVVLSVAGHRVSTSTFGQEQTGTHGRDQYGRQRDHISALAKKRNAEFSNAKPYILLGKFDSYSHEKNSLTELAPRLAWKYGSDVVTFSDFERYGLAQVDVDNILANVELALEEVIARSPGQRPIFFRLDGLNLDRILQHIKEKWPAWAKPYAEQELRLILRRRAFFEATRWLLGDRELSQAEVQRLFEPYFRLHPFSRH